MPHVFTSRAYPDKDCPPHFYARGHNPQYPLFGELMKYAERITGMISGGLTQDGEYALAIDVATALERERGITKNAAPAGITGEAALYL